MRIDKEREFLPLDVLIGELTEIFRHAYVYTRRRQFAK